MNALTTFLSDLFRDLRDRHLLPVIGLLVVAMVAVPIALRSEPQSPPPAAAPVPSSDDAAAVPAVMVAGEGVRDYRRRLELLQTKDPFADHYAPPAPVGSGEEAPILGAVPDAGEPSPVTSPPSEPSAPPSTDASTPPSVPTTDPTTSEPVVPDSGGTTSDDGGSSSNEGQPEVRVKEVEVPVAYRVDLTVGPVGELENREDVEQLAVLPGSSHPVAIFNGASEDGERAVFTLSSDVSATSGEGSCTPRAVDCQFLTLREGERRTLDYAPDSGAAVTYVLRLTGIHTVSLSG